MKILRAPDGLWWLERDELAAPLPDFDLDDWLARENPSNDLVAAIESATWQKAVVNPGLPSGNQEVWGAGVTYRRSQDARIEESDFSAQAYAHVYEAERPELFFKATPRRCVGPGGLLRLRSDSRWSVPEPELALLLDSSGRIAGYTIGNDLSSRDIEGENLLYLPQAKIWDGCCALGPAIVPALPEVDLRNASIEISIRRDGQTLFTGQTSVGQMQRSFEELAAHLFRDQAFPFGVYLLTGTGIVPDDELALAHGDIVEIEIEGIGILSNPVGPPAVDVRTPNA